MSPYRHLNNQVQSDHFAITISLGSSSMYLRRTDGFSYASSRDHAVMAGNGEKVRIGILVLKVIVLAKSNRENFLPFSFKDIFAFVPQHFTRMAEWLRRWT